MPIGLSLADFLGGMITLISIGAAAPLVLSGSARRVDLPALLGAYALQPSIPSDGRGVTSASPHRSDGQRRNVDRLFHLHRLSAYH